MTAIAGIEVGSACKLASVLIAVAIRAALKLDLEQSVSSLGGMALPALQPGMPSLQGIRGRRVIFYRKLRRLPPVDRVA